MTAIKTEDLVKRYKGVVAVNNLNLEVPDNTVFGFVGPNGAGKTTTIKMLTGFVRPSSGQAWVAGERIGHNAQALWSKIGLLPDVPAFYDWMTGRELLRYAGKLHGMDGSKIARRIEEVLELVEMNKAADRKVGGYSRGMRQRLGIAQALINRPKVLFLDEPTSALDPIGRREVLDLILRLRDSATVFLSTHILSDVERVCSMVGIVDKGTLVAQSTVEALQQKYARSVFEMEFMEDPQSLVSSLKCVPWAKDAAVVNDAGTPVVRVEAKESARARKELPGLIGSSGLTLTRYEMTLPGIEEIFMQIMSRRVAA